MILKSLSRKTPSFGQLAGYMSESGYMNSQKADDRFEIFRNCFTQNSADIAAEFQQNSQHLSRRKNGNYLYHEILSITIEEGVDRQKAKEALRELALKYVSERAPNNLAYGALHDDHSGHIHYHLMISANERGSSRRYWISAKKLDSIKRSIETECLTAYPELKQQLVMGASNEQKKLSRKASELKRQSKKLERHEYARSVLFQAMVEARRLDTFQEQLQAQGFTHYQRGKHHGVQVQHPDGRIEKYRFSTLGVAKEYEAYQETLKQFSEAERQSQTMGEEEVRKDLSDKASEFAKETARNAAHELGEAGKVFRYGVTGDEELGKTLKEQDQEDLQDYMKDKQQEKWRDEIANARGAQKDGPEQER